MNTHKIQLNNAMEQKTTRLLLLKLQKTTKGPFENDRKVIKVVVENYGSIIWTSV